MPGQPQTSLSQSATVACPVLRDAPDGRGLASVGGSTSSPDVPAAIIATGACLVKRHALGRGLASLGGSASSPGAPAAIVPYVAKINDDSVSKTSFTLKRRRSLSESA